MAQPHPIPAGQPAPAAKSYLTSLLLLLLTAAIILLAGYQIQPPRALDNSAPARAFSAERAMLHLTEIARAPHPSGSAENARVLAYLEQELQALGLETQTQAATGIFSKGQRIQAGHAVNLLGRLKGTANTKAVMLSAHYDSVHSGPGAADDGAGIVAILEAVRAIKASGPLKNDLIVLLTDNEEGGLIGASAFVAEHPWAKEVGVLANLEARGINGPSLMFRTGGESGWLIREFSKAVQHPVAFSVFDAMMKIIQNDTDMSAFRQGNLSGFDHAFIGGLTGYHTMDDVPENVSLASVQHHGEYVLGIAQHFGQLDLNAAPKEGGAVYFTLFGTVSHYPEGLALPLAILALIAFVGLLVLGVRRSALSGKGLLFGALSTLLSLVTAVVVTIIALKLTSLLVSRSLLWPAYDGALYIWATVGLTVAAHAALSIWYQRKLSLPNLTAGALIWWLLLALLTSATLPGASYFFTWPLLLGLGGLAVQILAPQRTWVAALLPLASLLLIVPHVLLLFVLFGAGDAMLAAIFVLLALVLLPLPLARIADLSKWLLPAGGLVAAVLLLGLAGWRIDQHPERSMVTFFQNADTSKAHLVGYPVEKADSWTSSLFPERETHPASEVSSITKAINVLADAQPLLPEPAPEAKLIKETTAGDQRTLTIQIRSPRKGLAFSLVAESPNPLQGAALDGRPIAEADLLRTGQLYFSGLPEAGTMLTLQVAAGAPVTLVVTDMTYSLPSSVAPKPAGVMAGPDLYADRTAIQKSFHF